LTDPNRLEIGRFQFPVEFAPDDNVRESSTTRPEKVPLTLKSLRGSEQQ
jgi:hypothetical protein